MLWCFELEHFNSCSGCGYRGGGWGHGGKSCSCQHYQHKDDDNLIITDNMMTK